ncbi:MAG: hypothetical protein IJR23_01085, partial [Lachnospiraceae bacterium]|nr:hypothetical protein [Lachnospiraceae bacterium]
NKKPLFGEKNLTVLSYKEIGKERKFFKLDLRTESGNEFSATCFDSPETFRGFLLDKYDESLVNEILSGVPTGIKIIVTYVPEINEFNGRTYINYIIKGYKHA